MKNDTQFFGLFPHPPSASLGLWTWGCIGPRVSSYWPRWISIPSNWVNNLKLLLTTHPIEAHDLMPKLRDSILRLHLKEFGRVCLVGLFVSSVGNRDSKTLFLCIWAAKFSVLECVWRPKLKTQETTQDLLNLLPWLQLNQLRFNEPRL